MKLDAIDRRILRALQRNGQIQNVELASEVGLSPSPCLRRVKLLEEAGIINRYVAVLDQGKVGLKRSMFARVRLTGQDSETIETFATAMEKLPEVVECYLILGDNDALMRVVVADLEDYRRFQEAHLTRKNGIRSVKTDVPSEIVKQTFALPI